ncbi:MAG: hypothetical protein IT440_11250 [Phycisphaeraceae bacterium]|nr:hypothetical protein [Phycisphaeraceae bacterium]
MPFRHGRVSFCRFFVGGDAPAQADETLLSILTEGAFAPTSVGAPPEVEAGWTTGEHVLDTTFEYGKNIFGDMLLFALRVDTHKPPAELKQAYQRMNEQTILAQRINPTGMPSRREKREASELTQQQLQEQLASGQFRKSKAVDVLWDLRRKTVLIGSSSSAVLDQFQSRFEQSFNVELEPITAGTFASRIMREHGQGRDFEDLRPSALTPAPTGAENEEAGGGGDDPRRAAVAPVPWTMSGIDTKSFLGNELGVWLWWHGETQEAAVQIDAPDGGKPADVGVMFDKALDMECAWGLRGKQSLRADGPTRLPEAAEALAGGKWPRKMGLMLAESDGKAYELAVQLDRLQIASAQLPEIEEANTGREMLEQRLANLRRLADLVDGLYLSFLKLRTSTTWQTRRQSIRQWIAQRRPARRVAQD